MAEKMETLKVQLRKEKAERVRATAMQQFGFSKGSISKALNEAVDNWMEKKSSSAKKLPEPDWDSVTGSLKEIKMSSVELQHQAFLPNNLKHRR